MNIFVAKLDAETTSDELRGLFEQYGEVSSANVIFDRETGHSRRFGFVEMTNDDDARNAIETLDDSEVGGRTIVVKEARPREERPRRDDSRGGGGYGGGGGGGYGGGGGGRY
ncbi:MAG: cold-inducible RNA-binding protein [Limisphaerales bacterium]|jgi:cold-inducible RNA-binding protein